MAMIPNNKFTYKWTQPYTSYSQISLSELDAIKELVIEQMLDAKDFKEADEVIARIKAL
jgi:hypothetical protein